MIDTIRDYRNINPNYKTPVYLFEEYGKYLCADDTINIKLLRNRNIYEIRLSFNLFYEKLLEFTRVVTTELTNLDYPLERETSLKLCDLRKRVRLKKKKTLKMFRHLLIANNVFERIRSLHGTELYIKDIQKTDNLTYWGTYTGLRHYLGEKSMTGASLPHYFTVSHDHEKYNDSETDSKRFGRPGRSLLRSKN